ncbi:EAL domain-containing protein [Fundidesulfovibrio magnetotacticus]|uniref:EAL domain-containing protein n=1 Tax=Fundidesulfovibrio magnetotacticus TaxID=2730080 RepID=UPI0015675297|nr:EAL domain-containing protein [Fundidesulfovibrio magnetotacticus]
MPPIDPVARGLRQFLESTGARFSEPYPGIYAIVLEDGALAALCGGFLCGLGEAEQRDTRSLIVEPGATPSIQELVQMQSLAALLARFQGQWLVEVLKAGRITSHFQPIVSCEDPGEVHGHECLLRGFEADGTLVAPGRMFDVARRGDLLFYLDRAARISAIESASRAGLEGKLFINFNPTSIYTPEYCLQTTLQAISAAGISHESIVFEVVESDEVKDTGHLVKVVEFYRAKGFRVALDDLGAGYSSLSLLHRLRPDYIKIDMEIARGVHEDPYKARVASTILDMARDLGMLTIAEGVETEGEHQWFRRNGADLAQGYLFGKPSPGGIRDASRARGA